MNKVCRSTTAYQTWTFFQKHYLLSEFQFGFRENKPTELAALSISDWVKHNIESSLLTMGVFVDVRETFDTIDHPLLCMNLGYCAVRWKQFVQLGESTSFLGVTSTGVPRGSILAPLSFLIYIGKLASYLDAQVIFCADDISIFVYGIRYRGPVCKNQLRSFEVKHLVNP